MSEATFLVSMHDVVASFKNIRIVRIIFHYFEYQWSVERNQRHRGKRKIARIASSLQTLCWQFWHHMLHSRRTIIWIFYIKITFIYEVKIIVQNWKLKYLYIFETINHFDIILIYLYQFIHTYIYNYYLNYLNTKLYL